jgi:uncharacterized cofD-like protein
VASPHVDWLYPGIGLKRWLFLAAAGALVLVYCLIVMAGVVWSDDLLRGLGWGRLADRHYAAAVLALDGILVGAVALSVGARRAWVWRRTNPETASEIRTSSRLARGPRVAAIGGGNGLAALLSGLKAHTSNLTAVVTMADDGGSSGRLRRDMGMPPPGDIRNCLVALADDESLMSRLFQYRFADGGLEGHSFGNLFVAALAEVTGDFERAVQESTNVLKVRGRVLPSTLDDVVLHAQLEDGARVSGESTITAAERLPRRVWLTPEQPHALPQAVDAVLHADMVVLGPGSLYTSVMPNLLIPAVRDAVKSTRAWVVYVCNVMTQPGETDGYTAADHLEALYRHGLAGMVDVVLVNDSPVAGEPAEAYERAGATPVVIDEERLESMGVRVARASLARTGDVVRHAPGPLSDALLRILH